MERIASTLAPFRRRAIGLGIVKGLMIGTLCLFLLWFGSMWLDLIWALPASLRWGLTRVGTIFAILAAASLCFWRIRHLTSENLAVKDLAMRIDNHASTGGEVLSGLELDRPKTKSESSLTFEMANAAVQRASKIVSVIAPRSVLPIDVLKRPLFLILSLAVIAALVAFFAPSMAMNQLQRFLFPSKNVPAYTGAWVSLEPSESVVGYGSDLTLNAQIRGAKADRMNLITIDKRGVERILPMLARTTDQFQTMLTRITEPLDIYATTGRHRSPVGRIEVDPIPEITKTIVRITPPAYTRGAVYEGKIPAKGIEGLPGTDVIWTVHSNRPLKKGVMEWSPDQGEKERFVWEVTENSEDPDSIHRASGGFPLERLGKFRIHVVDKLDVISKDIIEGTIAILNDRRPVIRIVEPRPVSLATPDINLPVAIIAEDDYGISNIRLYRSLNGSPATEKVFEVDGSARQSISYPLQLPNYGLSPGDEIQLFARCEDNDPEGSKGAESPITTIQIISVQEFQERMLQQSGIDSLTAKYEAAQRHLENAMEALRELEKAAEEAEKANSEKSEGMEQKEGTQPNNDQNEDDPNNDGQNKDGKNEDSAADPNDSSEQENSNPENSEQNSDSDMKEPSEGSKDQPGKNSPKDKNNPNAELQQKIEAARRAAEEAASEMDKLASNPMPLDVDKALSEDMKKMAEEVAKAAEQLRKMAQDQNGERPLTPEEKEEVAQMKERMGEQRKELEEEAIAPLEAMKKMLALMMDQQRFEQLAEAQEDLANRMESLKGADPKSPAVQRRAGDMEEIQRELEQELQQLTKDIEDHAAQLENDPEHENLVATAREFLGKLEFNEPGENMKSAEKNLAKSKFPDAAEEAKTASDLLNELLAEQGKEMEKEAEQECKNCFKPGKNGNKLGNSVEQLKKMMGMKPGKSKGQGQGTGTGQSQGMSQRNPGPQNTGMYGSMPKPDPKSKQGRGDKVVPGAATNSLGSTPSRNRSQEVEKNEGESKGQGDRKVPSQYRGRVSEYYQRLSDSFGVESQNKDRP